MKSIMVSNLFTGKFSEGQQVSYVKLGEKVQQATKTHNLARRPCYHTSPRMPSTDSRGLTAAQTPRTSPGLSPTSSTRRTACGTGTTSQRRPACAASAQAFASAMRGSIAPSRRFARMQSRRMRGLVQYKYVHLYVLDRPPRTVPRYEYLHNAMRAYEYV